MRRIKICAVILLLWICGIFNGCRQNVSVSGSTPETIDYNDYIRDRNSIAYTDYAYYFQDFHGPITYLDTSLTSGPQTICATANCDHTDEQCSAYLTGAYIFAYQNQLYYAGSIDDEDEFVLGLYRMEADGTERECIRQFAMKPEERADQEYCYNAGSGYLVLNGAFQGTSGRKDFLYLIPLEDPKAEPVEVYLEKEDLSKRIGYPSRAAGDWVFYQLYEEEKWEDWVFQCYQISSGVTKEIPRQWDEFLALKEDVSYWCSLKEGIFSYDLTTGEIQQILAWESPREQEENPIWYSIACDTEYFYVAGAGVSGQPMEEPGLIIYDLDGRKVQELSYNGMGYPLKYLLATPDEVIFGQADGAEEGVPTCYLERSAIGSGEAEFITFK